MGLEGPQGFRDIESVSPLGSGTECCQNSRPAETDDWRDFQGQWVRDTSTSPQVSPVPLALPLSPLYPSLHIAYSEFKRSTVHPGDIPEHCLDFDCSYLVKVSMLDNACELASFSHPTI